MAAFATAMKLIQGVEISVSLHVFNSRQYDILVSTISNYILVMTQPMPGPDKQFLSQMKQLKLTFLHVDWWWHLRRQ